MNKEKQIIITNLETGEEFKAVVKPLAEIYANEQREYIDRIIGKNDWLLFKVGGEVWAGNMWEGDE